MKVDSILTKMVFTCPPLAPLLSWLPEGRIMAWSILLQTWLIWNNLDCFFNLLGPTENIKQVLYLLSVTAFGYCIADGGVCLVTWAGLVQLLTDTLYWSHEVNLDKKKGWNQLNSLLQKLFLNTQQVTQTWQLFNTFSARLSPMASFRPFTWVSDQSAITPNSVLPTENPDGLVLQRRRWLGKLDQWH